MSKRLNKNWIKRFLIAIFSGLLVAGIVWAADTYYDLDEDKVIVNEIQRVTQNLEVVGSALLGDGGDTNYLEVNSTGDLSFYGTADNIDLSNATGQKISFTGGNIGIGTTDPSTLFHVEGGIVQVGDSAIIDYASGDGDAYIENVLEVDGTIYGNVAGEITPTGFDEGPVVFGGTGGALDQSNDLFWDNSNNYLGIGTTAPSQTLDVAGSFLLGNGAGTGEVNTSDWSIGTTGVLANISGYTQTDGAFSHTGTTSTLDLTGAVSWDTDSSMTIGAQSYALTVDGGTLTLTGDGTNDIDISNAGSAIDFDMATLDIDATGEIQIDGALTDFGTGSYTYADGDKDVGIAGDLEVLGSVYGSGSGTMGYWSRSGTYTYLDNTGDNVGIGTTAPDTFKLQVDGSIGPDVDDTYDLGSDTYRWQDLYTGPGSIHIGTSSTDEGLLTYNTTTDDLEFSTTGGDYYFDVSNGNVGIGTTGPGTKLEVSGNVTLADTKWLGLGASSNRMVFNSSDGTALMGGNIGIGTTNPQAKMDVRGTIENGLVGWWPMDEGTGQVISDYSINSGMGARTPAGGFDCGTDMVSDPDGATYETVLIGSQCWMAENYDYDGSTTGDGCKDVTWVNDSDEGWCGYYSGTDNGEGLLYQWSAVMDGEEATEGDQGICPDGWHLPTDSEMCTLEQQVCEDIGNSNCASTFDCTNTGWRGQDTSDAHGEGSALAGNEPLWNDNDIDNDGAGDNDFGTSGFDVLPAGGRLTDGSFYGRGSRTNFWSSSGDGDEAWRRYLGYNHTDVYRDEYSKAYGFSVRCVKD